LGKKWLFKLEVAGLYPKNIMAQEKRIAFVICYFGKLPWYFEYFVHSCKYNATIDFFIYTDDTLLMIVLPSNVKLVYTTLPEISLLFSEKLGFVVKISYGYKLCDFKPTYGLIFSDILKDYDFWGHCDIDIILGNIRDFITGDILEDYDLISVRHDWISGCFLLYRNDKKLNTLFKKSKDYKKVLSSDIHYCFDETNFAHAEFTLGKSYRDINTEVESMMHVVKKMEDANYIKPFFDFFIIEGRPGRLYWIKGKLLYRKRFEVLLYHLIYLKRHYVPATKRLNIPDYFCITPTRILNKRQPKLMTDEF
jgi:hypothetical protein